MSNCTKTRKTSILTLIILAVFAVVVLMGCNVARRSSSEGVVRVGLVGEEIKIAWEKVVEIMAAEGVRVELVTFSDYATPNRALADGEIDLNSFQHNAYLQSEINNHGYRISKFGNTVLYFLGVYSTKITSLDQLQNGDTIMIMNDATNGGRALKVLEAAGVLRVDPTKGNLPTVHDIIENPRNIRIVEVDAPFVYRNLNDPQVTAGISNSAFVTDAGDNPAEVAIFIKPICFESDEPYINIIAGRNEDRDNPLLKRVVAAFQSEEVRRVVLEVPPMKGVALPAW